MQREGDAKLPAQNYFAKASPLKGDKAEVPFGWGEKKVVKHQAKADIPSKAPQGEFSWLQAPSTKLGSHETCSFISTVPLHVPEPNILKAFSSRFVGFLCVFNAPRRKTRRPVRARLARTPLGAEVRSPGQKGFGGGGRGSCRGHAGLLPRKQVFWCMWRS